MEQDDDLLVVEFRHAAIGGGFSVVDHELPNVANYRNIIVDAVSVGNSPLELAAEDGARTVQSILRFNSKVDQVVRAGGTAAVLLPSARTRDLRYQEQGSPRRLPLDDAIPGPFRYITDPGLRVDHVTEVVRRYFEQIRNVDGCIECTDLNLNTITQAFGTFGQNLAMTVQMERGVLIYLPPYATSATQAIDIVAADILNRPRTQIVWPEWIYTAPFESVQRGAERLERARNGLSSAEERLQRCEEEFDRLKAPLRVVIGTGIDGLQKPCEELLREMGFSTLAPPPSVSDEFILASAGMPILVEVKGIDGPAVKAHMTQLLADAANLEELQKTEVKPLLLVNSLRQLPVQEREAGKNHPFGQWIEDHAGDLGAAFMTTWDLLMVYYAVQSEPKLASQFLKDIVETNGRIMVSKFVK
jgi:hypothetical protein